MVCYYADACGFISTNRLNIQQPVLIRLISDFSMNLPNFLNVHVKVIFRFLWDRQGIVKDLIIISSCWPTTCKRKCCWCQHLSLTSKLNRFSKCYQTKYSPFSMKVLLEHFKTSSQTDRSKSVMVRDDQTRGTLSHFKYSANIQLGHVNNSPCWNSYHSVTHLSVPLVYIDHTLLQNHQIMILFTNVRK